MSTIRFEVRDAADVRFRVSPLWETVRSRYALADPGRYVVHLPWIRRVRTPATDPALVGSLRVLDAIARPGAWLPDFLTPPPARMPGDIEEELAAVAATPPEVVVADLRAVAARSPLPPPVGAGLTAPDLLVADLVKAVRIWHRVAVAPYWPRMRALLEADIAHRCRHLAEGGVRRLVGGLHPSLRWAGDHIVADDPWHIDHHLRGRGLPLMPSVFVDRRVLWSVRPDSVPLAVYPVRAVATLWEGGAIHNGALAGVLGTTRARLLTLLTSPATTTELARRVALTPAAVSQHLTALHAAGLVTRVRHGRGVLYVSSPAGRSLLTAGGESADVT
ncbi:helix-turn-helix domain-containing protein [Micromonospora endolithica]|uniref:ArsR family transcriptional regulator n=1 Tax=Micromonospora endolithica TaxID=230091 RepID=A0A3A9ZHN7_9ACTN|nr:helix-turn-helix domain-containing protein [Micromonospora endolithica]RKN47868.1 ArsR family transcriptional regulator [Micromonospora endolithica]TWJ21566.1 helix-turn-helix protein [Micromonospora endolithica]